jgi:hypothetical protein
LACAVGMCLELWRDHIFLCCWSRSVWVREKRKTVVFFFKMMMMMMKNSTQGWLTCLHGRRKWRLIYNIHGVVEQRPCLSMD